MSPRPGQTDTPVRLLLQAEGAAVLGLSLWAYAQTGMGWLLFAVLFLLPDATMLGYLRNPHLGAQVYNLGHTYVLPVLLIGAGLWSGSSVALGLGLIWTAHIGTDRLVGYGLKYSRSFQATHLMSRD
jgi:Domain of unknown function (DUF4260)